MRKFNQWVNEFLVENANPAQAIQLLQKKVQDEQTLLTQKLEVIKGLDTIAKQNANALPQLQNAINLALQKNDFKTLQQALTQFDKQKPAPPVQQQQKSGNQQQIAPVQNPGGGAQQRQS
jgi:hypothetical protein